MSPNDLVSKLTECASTDFSISRDHWFRYLATFTTMVAIGLIFEAPELAIELAEFAAKKIPFLKDRINIPEDYLHIAKVIAFIGWILIVVGVAGERVAEVKVNDFDIRIEQCSDAKVREAVLEAGDAKTSAKSAGDAVERAQEELEKMILLDGPRENLLLRGNNRQMLLGSLRPFAGQKIEVRRATFVISVDGVPIGGSQISDEENGTAEALISILREARWILPNMPLSSGTPGKGISVQVARNASFSTQKSAEALTTAFRTIPVVITEPTVIADDLTKRSAGEQGVSPTVGRDTIILVVHPK